MSIHSYKKLTSGWWILGGIIVVVVALFLLGQGSSTSGKTNREVALICTTDMATQFHIHPHLQILVNGQPQEIPAGVGISFTCMNALHTHDTSGTIHVESPEQRDFTLSDFFAVWNKPFSKDQILDYKVDDNHILTVTVNGEEIGTYENTVLRDKDQIVINYSAK